MFNATVFKGQVLYENEYGFLEYSLENKLLSKTSNAFNTVLRENPVHKINQTMTTMWLKTTENELSDPCP